MTPPIVGSYAQMLYDRLEPFSNDDENQGWALLHFCEAIGRMYQQLHDLISDSDEGPGWSSILDVERCAVTYLPYLAQFVGVRLPKGIGEDEARDRVRTPSGFARGTRAAMIAAAQRLLTDTKHISLIERNGSAYQISAFTLTSETPDPDLVEKALLSEKPGGLVLTYAHGAGTFIDELIGDIDSQTGDIDSL